MNVDLRRRAWLRGAGSLAAGAPLFLGASSLRAAAVAEHDAASAVREALQRGAVAAVGLLGRTDGFLGNPRVRIPLPGMLEDAARLLKSLGQGRRVDELVTAMNRAAEQAVPQAKAMLQSAVRRLTIEDALDIVRGGETAVTQFFERKTREPLTQQFLPIVTRATERVALAQKFNAVASRAAGLGLVKGESTSIEGHVTAKALDGLYLVIGDEEKKIRRDPVGTGSAILGQVFAGLR